MVSVVNNLGTQGANPAESVGHWLNHLAQARPGASLSLIKSAVEFAQQAHSGQFRASGEPYVHHALAVADILAGLNLDEETIVAALLHDVVEDTDIGLDEIERKFGASVARLVDGVTKMDAIEVGRRADSDERKHQLNAEAMRKMLLAMVEDVRVVLIKLADRLHNMRTLCALSEQQQRRIARETMEIFAPLANRLGIWDIKWELEDLAFRYLEPEMYKKIARLLNERRVDRERYIADFIDQLSTALKDAGIEAVVNGRPKHIYSIYRKMQRKEMDYGQIYDVRATRVLVKEVRDCYAALGIVHSKWQYIPGEFDDYIATPKANRYRSLHTAVIGPEGKTVEVQIRTQEMHRHSEFGVAAHWRYKEGAAADSAFEGKIAVLRQVLEWKDEVRDASEFVDKMRTEVFSDRIYVFTPKGHVMDLPRGATPLDFAYHIHSEVGHRCRGAKVNGKIVPLTYELDNGEQVEIITVKKGDPSRDWLNPHLGYLHSSKARAKVLAFFKLQSQEEAAKMGRHTLDRELKRLGFREVNLERLGRESGFDTMDGFYAAVGRGEVRISQVLAKVQEIAPAPAELKVPKASMPRARSLSGAVDVLGVGNLLTHFAQCCHPLPGDEIKGFITRGRGVSIHRSDCPNMLRFGIEVPQRVLEVHWGQQADQSFAAAIQIIAYDRHGLLRDISTVLANEKVNVTAVDTQSNPKTNRAHMRLNLEVDDIEKLSRVLTKISQLPNIIEARRVDH